MHRQLKGFLRMGRAPMSAGQLQALCSVLEKETSAHRRVEFSSRRYWTLVYLSTNPDRSWPAVALRPVRQGWLVQLTSLTLQAVLKTSKKLREDQALTVGVQRVDPKEDRLTLTLLTS